MIYTLSMIVANGGHGTMAAIFRIRYRVHQTDGTRSAMVIEDSQGILYLFSNGQLQVRLNSLSTWQRISKSLSRARYAWQPVDDGDPIPLEALEGQSSSGVGNALSSGLA